MTDDDHDGCRGCGRHLEPGWSLCEKCSSRLSDDLLEIASRYDRVTAAPGYSPGSYDQTRAPKPGSRPPLNMGAAEMRDDRSGAVDKLDQWAWRICVERGYETSPEKTVDGAVEFLNRHDDWIAHWWRAGEVTERINAVLAAHGEPRAWLEVAESARRVDDAEESS